MNLRNQGIIRSESGIIKKDGIYFHTSSGFAQQNLFYALWGANYLCTAPYRVDRKGFNAFLFFFIQSGEMYFEYRGRSFVACKNDVVLLDCNYQHYYYANEPVQFYWFHFHGACSAAYCDLLWKDSGALFKNLYALEGLFLDILKMLPMEPVADDRISVTIHRILSLLNTNGHMHTPLSSQIIQAQQWMDAHFKENISISDVAEQVSLSRYYFSRRFREETGMTPHDYLMNVRISYAKDRLANHVESIEQIAYDCAFCSSSNFIQAFKTKTGITPHQFRSIIAPK